MEINTSQKLNTCRWGILLLYKNKAGGHLPENMNPLFTNLFKADLYLDAQFGHRYLKMVVRHRA